jgi:hypothetical protein
MIRPRKTTLRQYERSLRGENTKYGMIRVRKTRLDSAMSFAKSELTGTSEGRCKGALIQLLRLRKDLREGDERKREWLMRTYFYSIPELGEAARQILKKWAALRALPDVTQFLEERHDEICSIRKQNDYKDLNSTALHATVRRKK